jgi:anti-sigma factor RsiW
MNGDEETLSEYIDGRLAPVEKEAFERRLGAEPALARRLRLLRAMRSSLIAGARAMPADLKAELKRRARARAPKPRRSLRQRWLAAFGGAGLGCGLGAAFAAALLAFAVRLALPRHGRPAAATFSVWKDAAASEGLKNLWSDDDGRDG